MTVALEQLTTPAAGADYRVDTGHRKVGLGLGAVGIVIAMVVAALSITAGIQIADVGDETTIGQILAIAFGFNTLALATLKLGISVVLVGILVRLWMRVEANKRALPAIQTENVSSNSSTTSTPYGPVTTSAHEPAEMPIHKIAKTLWGPMLAMGYMLVVGGLVAAIVWAANIGTDLQTAVDASAWTQGIQFLGEAFVLAGISFLLASILRGLRQGGGQVQEALGVSVLTPKMPAAAKGFIALMMAGVVIAIVQFVGYVNVTTFDDPLRVASWFAFLGPLRELSLGVLLAGIVLALATIGQVLGFQFWRIRNIVTGDNQEVTS
jgi:hypothetical protein